MPSSPSKSTAVNDTAAVDAFMKALQHPFKTEIHDRAGLLEGDYKDRRLAHFHDAADVAAKKPALVRVVNQWIDLMER